MSQVWKNKLQEEIARRKAQLAQAKATGPAAAATTTSDAPAKRSKYLKRSELYKHPEPAPANPPSPPASDPSKSADTSETSKAKLAGGNGTDASNADYPNHNANSGYDNDDDDAANLPTEGLLAEWLRISPEETVRRLRQRGHPIRLFGETDRRRAIRLRQIEIAEEHSEGQQNDFMKKMEETETGLALEALQRQAEGGRPTGLTSSDQGDGPSLHPDGSSAGDNDPLAPPTKRARQEVFMSEYDTTLLNRDLLKSDPSLAYTLVYVYLKRLLFEWGDDLAQRPEEIRTSGPGKRETATQRLSSEHLEPLFKRLKRQRVESDIIDLIVEIARCLQAREYLQANEAYLQMSIGNAAWPIGVTMVGIHARSAREKISSNQVAHVLNTEEQRKWIQSLKRLMTFAQNKYPPTDGAKAVG
ncbi:hypothetical protein H4R33_001410 [Dimargaris cristalligena]|nr:hypothetical protein H4R33_001410 [Dimargaris cristalligena]